MRKCWIVLLWLMAGMPTMVGQAKRPSVVFDSISKDLGRLTQGEAARWVFAFSNKGAGTLEILSVETSCGCTTALLSAKKVAPGKSGRIDVKIDTAGMFDEMGKQVYVKTNDPRHSDVTLTIRAIIEPEIEMSDTGIFFGNAPRGKEVRREVILTIPAQKSIRILSAESTDPKVAVKLQLEPGSNSKKWRLIAIRKADAKPGDHFGEIVVKTTSSLTPTISIYETGTVTAPGK